MPIEVTVGRTETRQLRFTPMWVECLDYTGREDSEEQIVKYLSDKNVVGPFISGFHGVGKTTLATRVVSKRKDSYEDIFFITVPESVSGDLEEFLIYVLREIEKYSTYEFDKKHAEKSFLSFVQSKHSCFIMDDFDIPICCEFMRLLSFYEVKSKFIFASNRNLNFYQDKIERRNRGRVNLADRFPQVVISDFSKAEAESFIEKRLTRSGIYSPNSIDHIKKKLTAMNFRHPYELVLILSHIEQNIADGDISQLHDFSLRYSVATTYNTILSIVSEDWGLLTADAKVLLCFVSFFTSGANLSFLRKHSETLNRMWDSVLELEKYNLIFNIGRGSYTVNTLTKQALDSFQNEENYFEKFFPYYQRARNLWVEICDKIVSKVRDCYNEYSLMGNVDKAGGIEFVKSVIKWCMSEERYDIADRIGINASYYCYARGDGSILTDSIEMFRYKCAEVLEDSEEMSNALAAQLNISSKRGRIEDAALVIELLRKLNYKPDRVYSEVRLLHAWGQYYLATEQYDKAYEIWHSLYLRRNNLRPMDVGTVSRWLCECMRRMKKSDEEILTILKGSLISSKEHNATRDILQCSIQIAEIQISSGKITNEEVRDFLQLERNVNDVGDPSFRAQYYFLKYQVDMLRNEPELARESLMLSKENYDTIFNAKMSQKIDSLLSSINNGS